MATTLGLPRTGVELPDYIALGLVLLTAGMVTVYRRRYESGEVLP